MRPEGVRYPGRSVVRERYTTTTTGMVWIRIDNNKMTWCCYMTWASPLLIFSFMRSFPPKIAGRSCVPRRFATRSMPTSKRLKGPDALVRNTVELPTCSFSENHPRGGVADAFRARRLMSLYPGLKHPTSQSLRRGWLFGVTYHNMRGAIASATAAWAILLDRSAVTAVWTFREGKKLGKFENFLWSKFLRSRDD